MKSKVDLIVETLSGHGHSVRPYEYEGQLWFEVDGVLHRKMKWKNLSVRLHFLLNSYNDEKTQFNNPRMDY